MLKISFLLLKTLFERGKNEKNRFISIKQKILNLFYEERAEKQKKYIRFFFIIRLKHLRHFPVSPFHLSIENSTSSNTILVYLATIAHVFRFGQFYRDP